MDRKIKDIPGFYYDPEKKRYFQISEDFPRIPSFRLKKDVPKDAKDTKKKKKKKKKCHHESKFSLLLERSFGKQKSYSFQRNYRKLLICDENWPESQKEMEILCSGSLYPGEIDCSMQTIVANPRQDSIAVLSKVVGQERSLFQMYKVVSQDGLNLKFKHTYPDFLLEQISSICWNPHDQNDNTVILSTLVALGGTLLLYSFRSMSEYLADSPLAFRHERYRTRLGTIWTARWNPNTYYKQMIGLGSCGGFALRTIGNWRSEKSIKVGSDVFALDFGRETHMVCCGSRDGNLRIFDLRSLCPFPTNDTIFVHNVGKSLDWIKLLQDEDKLMLSTFDGRIELWDLKMRRCLRRYLGHENSHSRLKPHVTPDEEFVSAVGEDNVGRVWHVASGDLLKTIPFPSEFLNKSVSPCLVYGNSWGGNSDLSGFLYGVKRSVYFHRV